MRLTIVLIALALEAGGARADQSSALDGVGVERDVVYAEHGARRLTLDVYRPRDVTGPAPVLVFVHGGGWVLGRKDDAVPELAPQPGPADLRAPSMLPYLRRGVAVVSVDYRLAREARAPAAVDDCRQALAWVHGEGARHGLDPKRIVPIGPSAGGHLALMLGLGADAAAAGVVGVVDLYGITDVADVLDGPNARWWAREWLAPGADGLTQARRLSPIALVRRDVPPVLIIHGDQDREVPYRHATQLRDALAAAGAPVELLTVSGGGHGFFTAEQLAEIQARIFAFLGRVGLVAR